MMIDWDALAERSESTENKENNPKSRALPDNIPTDSTSRADLKPNTVNGFSGCARHARHARPKNSGVGDNEENLPSREGVASENLRDAKTYFCHPIAVSLLLAVCYKFEASGEEILQAIIKLQTIPPLEQVRSWATLCHNNDIDPHQIIYPFTNSPGKGYDCQGCQHIDMQTINKPDERRLYHWVCKLNHSILESHYVGKRALIAPESCNDYLPTV